MISKNVFFVQNEAIISDLEERLKKEEKQRQELEKIRRQLEAEIAELRDQIADLQMQLEELRAQNQRKDDEIAALQEKWVRPVPETKLLRGQPTWILPIFWWLVQLHHKINTSINA